MADLPVPSELEVIRDLRRAVALLHALRLRILHQAVEAISATEAAGRLGLSRQRVNHHFRQLLRAGLLRAAGRRRKRNMFEKRYVASARGYALSPELLGDARADWRTIGNARGVAYLLALLSHVESDLSRLWKEEREGGAPLQTISLKTQFRFRSEEQRANFARAFRDALAEVVFRHTDPMTREDGAPAPGRPHRLVVACYPYAPESETATRPEAQ